MSVITMFISRARLVTHHKNQNDVIQGEGKRGKNAAAFGQAKSTNIPPDQNVNTALGSKQFLNKHLSCMHPYFYCQMLLELVRFKASLFASQEFFALSNSFESKEMFLEV
jgi:hypothetical protein